MVKVTLDSWKHMPEVLRVNDVQEIMGIGINQAYNLLRSGAFHHVRIGRLIMIPKPGFIAWLEGEKQ
ncbi:helix-turn-helix domain-containing protein [Paenibacillus sp. BR2-3]